jgi:hypothetical protein
MTALIADVDRRATGRRLEADRGQCGGAAREHRAHRKFRKQQRALAFQHRLSDAVHLVASGVWIGALVVFSRLVTMSVRRIGWTTCKWCTMRWRALPASARRRSPFSR